MTRTVILLCAFLLDTLFGEPPNRIHPVAWMGTVISRLWKRRPGRKDTDANTGADTGASRSKLFVYGMLITLLGAALFSAPVAAVSLLPPAAMIAVSVLLLTPMFSLRKLLSVGKIIAEALERQDLEAARALTSYHLVSRPTENLSREDVTAAVIESLAENLTDSFVSPLLYFGIAGLPGAWAYRYVNTSDAMLGYRTGAYEWGGKFAARLDDALNFVPARLTALAMVLTSWLLGKSWRSKGMLHRIAHWQKTTASPNAGWSISAAAVTLGVRLEKHGHYVINPDGRDPQMKDLLACITLVRTTAVLILISLAAAGILVFGAVPGGERWMMF
jgi:adenosylcobinamide-phosphate synthase